MRTTQRTPAMQQFLDKYTKTFFRRPLTTSLQEQVCVYCGKEAKVFKDPQSQKEYQTSGLCQTCQDEVFKPPKGE